MSSNHLPDRRKFLKLSALAGLAATIQTPFDAAAQSAPGINPIDRTDRLTLLITADLHAQLNTHDEFFWEKIS